MVVLFEVGDEKLQNLLLGVDTADISRVVLDVVEVSTRRYY